jgi:hypothetical protein
MSRFPTFREQVPIQIQQTCADLAAELRACQEMMRQLIGSYDALGTQMRSFGSVVEQMDDGIRGVQSFVQGHCPARPDPDKAAPDGIQREKAQHFVQASRVPAKCRDNINSWECSASLNAAWCPGVHDT